MPLILKVAWRNLFRQRRRTFITVSAIALSLILSIPGYGLMEGMKAEMNRGITGLELGDLQIHDPAYPKGRALESTLRDGNLLLNLLRKNKNIIAATPRVHGFALASHDRKIEIGLAALPQNYNIIRGKNISSKKAWQHDQALACEILASTKATKAFGLTIGMMLSQNQNTDVKACERFKIVGFVQSSENKLYLDPTDLLKLKKDNKNIPLTIKHSATLTLFGIEPGQEKKVSFVAEKIVDGRYLNENSHNEIVIGKRLAETLRLKLGDKLFVQAGAIDQSSGNFYRDFKVVGFYKTGVDAIDRVRAFLLIRDAQELIGLGDKIHEIAATTTQPTNPEPIVKALEKEIHSTLTIANHTDVKFANTKPLPAPIHIYHQRKDKKTTPISPYDLKRRFDELKTIKAVGRRVYGHVNIFRTLSTQMKLGITSPQLNRKNCQFILDTKIATRFALKKNDRIWLKDNDALDCSFNINSITDLSQKSIDGEIHLISDLLIKTSLKKVLIPKKKIKTSFVGIESDIEAKLGLRNKIASGTYLPIENDDDHWPLLISTPLAKELNLKIGDTLLLERKDHDQKIKLQTSYIVGILNSSWPSEQPQLILAYYLAQQIDALRLNAKAHELVVIPKKDVDKTTLIQTLKSNIKPLVRSWKTIAPDMAKLIDTQDVWMAIFMLILFSIASMTVMNTMLMAVFERTREFGVLKSIGMKPSFVFSLIVLETLALTFIAIVIGGAIGFGLNHLAVVYGIDLRQWTDGFSYQGAFLSPIWKAIFHPKIILMPILLVSSVSFIVSLYPAFRAARLKPIDALRSEQ